MKGFAFTALFRLAVVLIGIVASIFMLDVAGYFFGFNVPSIAPAMKFAVPPLVVLAVVIITVYIVVRMIKRKHTRGRANKE